MIEAAERDGYGYRQESNIPDGANDPSGLKTNLLWFFDMCCKCSYT